MKIALCQVNTTTGNIAYNTRRIIEELENAAHQGARLAVFPEMCITGYPPKDLLEYQSFVEQATQALTEVQDGCRRHKIDCIVGTVHTNIFGGKKELLNAAAFVSKSGDIKWNFKKLLPTYDVFDEHRYFQPCPVDAKPSLINYDADGMQIGVSICEDIWNDNEFWKDQPLYEIDPIEKLAASGANLIVNISASPFVAGKPARRVAMLRHVARRWNVPILIVNQVGGCDTVIFDGGSMVVLPSGEIASSVGWFSEQSCVWNSAASAAESSECRASIQRVSDDIAAIHDALLLGLRDYLRKTHFKQVIVGNSGGIDSAVVLTLCTAAIGAENVISVSMPGPYTSRETQSDSEQLARNLGVRHLELPIVEPFKAFQQVLRGEDSSVTGLLFGGDAGLVSRLADENIQARLRGNILMWLSNAITSPNTLVVSTGNKSEVAAGYCTLYGDMAGGLSLISDVPKMTVYKLARFLNGYMEAPIPQSIIDREPTAELAPNQKDSDSLPPYPVLDEIIRLYIEERKGRDEIIATQVAPDDIVRRVIRMIDNAEYKRAQAAPGLKVTSKAFGFGRRMPIARG
jgi:NAD+ synthase (glutamine-hydrolysing)